MRRSHRTNVDGFWSNGFAERGGIANSNAQAVERTTCSGRGNM